MQILAGHNLCEIFGMAAMPFHCNLPRALSVLVLKIASCLYPYIDSFLIFNCEWPTIRHLRLSQWEDETVVG